MTRGRYLWAAAGTFCLALGHQRSLAVVPAPLFCDHVVLQCNQAVPIWGTAKSGEMIVVNFAGQSARTRADSHGQWKVFLPALAANSDGRDLTIAGNELIVLRDVVVGEVWLISGQSNMAWKLSEDEDAARELPEASKAGVRQFATQRTIAAQPAATVAGEWSVCSTATAGDYSAVAWYFATAIHRETGAVIGLINATWGNTPIEAWLPRDVAEKLPSRFAATESYQATSVLFNGMIHPHAPAALRGILWYQGESNVSFAPEYSVQFPALIQSWRRVFEQSELPFYWVQLPRYRGENPDGVEWAELREAQTRALALPATGQAVSLDQGTVDNIHPSRKREVGTRLARLALHQVYGLKVSDSGPIEPQFSFEGLRCTIRFGRGADGLKSTPAPLQEFQVAGEDRTFYGATARLEGQSLIVTAGNNVKKIEAVRYAWRNAAAAQLFNQEGLPAAPFRSDRW